jgi:hypothetical protein
LKTNLSSADWRLVRVGSAAALWALICVGNVDAGLTTPLTATPVDLQSPILGASAASQAYWVLPLPEAVVLPPLSGGLQTLNNPVSFGVATHLESLDDQQFFGAIRPVSENGIQGFADANQWNPAGPVPAVPAPAALPLAGLGLAAALGFWRRPRG